MDGTKLIYQSYVNGLPASSYRQRSGTGQVRSPPSQRSPSLSPDGKTWRMRSVRKSGDLHGAARSARTEAVDRFGRHHSTACPERPGIAFTSNFAGPPQIYLMDLEGANREGGYVGRAHWKTEASFPDRRQDRLCVPR